MSLIEHLTIDVCKALPYFYAFTGCDTVSSFNGKCKCTFFDTWMESKKKNDLTKTFIKLGNMPESINSDDRNTLEFPVKTVDFGNVKDIENISLNEIKHQFIRSTSNDLKKVAPYSDALNVHSLRAAHTAGFERVECLHNVSVPDPSVRGYVLKDDMFVSNWLSKFLPLTLQNFFKHANAKQQSV